MAQKQSPGYPNFPLSKAIDLAGQIFEKDRKNPIDRDVAAQHVGYSGLSGPASKALATLAHYRLVEKAGKGQLRVTQTLVDILYPDSDDDKRAALLEAAFNPTIFASIHERFPDGTPSEGNLKAWLMREEFLDRAISPVSKAYLETIRFLEQERAFDTGADPTEMGADSLEQTDLPEMHQKHANSRIGTVEGDTFADAQLNKINAQIAGDTVRISALLNKEGLDKLEKKIAALRDFLSDD